MDNWSGGAMALDTNVASVFLGTCNAIYNSINSYKLLRKWLYTVFIMTPVLVGRTRVQ